MAETKKYRVLSGRHIGTLRNPDDMTNQNDKNTNVYKKGDVVESEDDLIAKFPNKFELVADEPTKPKGKKKLPKVELPAEDVEEEAEEAETEEAGEADTDAGEETEDEDEAGEEEAEEKSSKKPKPKPPTPTLGKDVTDQFRKAVRADLKVFKDGKVYNVADADEPTKVLEGGGDLETKKDVETFVSKYLTK